MKKIFLVLVICGLATTGFSQFLKKGSIIGGGSFQFQTIKYKDSDSKGHYLSISPWAGYMVIDNLAIGTGLEFQNSGSKNTISNSKSTSNGIFLTPFVRYYLDQGIFFMGQYGFGSSKSKNEINGNVATNKNNSSLYRLGVGYAARVTPTVLFEPTIGYYGASNGNNNKSGGLFISGGFTIILKTVQ
jgi:outer membrane protein